MLLHVGFNIQNTDVSFFPKIQIATHTHNHNKCHQLDNHSHSHFDFSHSPSFTKKEKNREINGNLEWKILHQRINADQETENNNKKKIPTKTKNEILGLWWHDLQI